MTPDDGRTVGLLDTSIFIARESGRPIDLDALPDEVAVSVVTIGELRWGVMMAPDDDTRARRLRTVSDAARLEPTPIDDDVAHAWSLLMTRLRASRRTMEINDSWIAATAMAQSWSVVTQDGGFPSDIADLTVLHV